jgi:hypothetical protein
VCIAVGTYTHGSTGDPVPFSEKWSGGSWGSLSTPVPSGSPDTELVAVGCSSASSCTAVGDYEAPDGHNGFFVRPLAERLGGGGWSIESTAAVSGDGAMNAVSCVSATECVAVGFQSTIEGGAASTLVERWNGTWTKQTSANPRGGTNSVLSGVSCNTSGSCAAVGKYVAGSATLAAFAEGSSGSSWAIQTTPVPGGTTFSQLLGVSCASTGSCEAVGDYRAGSGSVVTLAEVSASGKWTRQTTPNRSGATTNELNGIACPSTTGCEAVGYNNGSEVVEATLALRFT